MDKRIKFIVILALGNFFEGEAQMAHQFNWTFPEGNLVANWSFERDADEICLPSTGSSFSVTDCKFKMSEAPSGDFVMKIAPGAISLGASPSTDFIRLEPGLSYAFSVWVKGNWDTNNTGETAPVLEFFTEAKTGIGTPLELASYESVLDVSTTDWNLYSASFQAPANAAFFKFRILKVLSLQEAANTFYFDNLLIQAAEGSQRVVENRSYLDAVGVVEQTVTGNGKRDVVSFTTYDSERRPSRQYVPIAIQKAPPLLNPSLITVGTQAPGENLAHDFPTVATAYESLVDWASSLPASSIDSVIIHAVVDAGGSYVPIGIPLDGEFQPLISEDGQEVSIEMKGLIRYTPEYQAMVDAHGPPARSVPTSTEYRLVDLLPSAFEAQYPGESNFFSEFAYPAPGESTIGEMAVPGNGYALSSGHTDKLGWALVDAITNTASDPEMTGPAAPAGTDGLLYQWTRDRQGKYFMSLSNPEGLVTRSGHLLAGEWNQADYAYDSFNRTISTLSPAGVLATSEYNGQSQTIQTFDPNRGETNFLYDDFGRLRFVHPAEGGTATAMVAHKYDAVGRLVQSGATPFNWDESEAENSQAFPSADLETGRLYDAFTELEWQNKTGVPWATLGINIAMLKNGKGKVVAAYNLNPEVTAPGFALAPDRRLVASIYSYDSLGRLETLFKWIGAAEIPSQRIQKITHRYDGLGRLASKQVYATGLGNQVVNVRRFEYDADGRVRVVFDKDSRAVLTYTRNDLGQLVEAILYGKFKVNWTYSIRGELRKILATTMGANPEYIFSEEMGYDSKPNSDNAVPDPITPQYNGNISSILRKFSKDVIGPVELSQNQYDDLGRLVQADRISAQPQTPSLPVLNNDGSINFSNVTFTSGATTATESFAYNEDGAIISQTRPGTGIYAYDYYGTPSDPTHKVKDVSGSRATGEIMTASGGNFRYDARGRLTDDIGSLKHFTYGFYSDRVVTASVPGRTFHMFYDENMNRVAELEESGSGVLIGSKVTVYESGLNVVKEYVSRTSAHPLGAVGLVKNSLMGEGSLVGFENQATGEKKLLLKDHLGSIVKILDERTGNYTGQEEYAYWTYGILERRVAVSGDMKPHGTFTGKSYEEALGLYYFGARFFDPELGIWMSPDPIGQFFNPYSYGGDPVNFVDPDGRCLEPLSFTFCAAGAIAGAYVGGALAQKLTEDNRVEWNPTDWDRSHPATYVGMLTGGLLGAVAGYYLGPSAGIFGAYRLTLGYEGATVPVLTSEGGGDGAPGNSEVDAGSGPPPNDFPDLFMNAGDVAEYQVQRAIAYKKFIQKYSELTAQLSYWIYEDGNHNTEAGFLWRPGKGIVGPYRGVFDFERNTPTMGNKFGRLIQQGDDVVHVHIYEEIREMGLKSGLSKGDFAQVTGPRKAGGIYAYEVSNGRIYYTNPGIIKKWPIQWSNPTFGPANMYIGSWDYHQVERRKVRIPFAP